MIPLNRRAIKCQYCDKTIGKTEAVTVVKHNWTCSDCTYKLDHMILITEYVPPKRTVRKRLEQLRLFTPPGDVK